MEAKDTVKELTHEELIELTRLEQECVMAERYAQAEISFKAGIREMAEWIERNPLELYWKTISTTKRDHYIPLVMADTWQAKLKEWGI